MRVLFFFVIVFNVIKLLFWLNSLEFVRLIHEELSSSRLYFQDRNDKYEPYSHDWIRDIHRHYLIAYDRNRYVYVYNLFRFDFLLDLYNEFEQKIYRLRFAKQKKTIENNEPNLRNIIMR